MEWPGGGAPLNKGRSRFQHEPEGEGVTSPLSVRMGFRRVLISAPLGPETGHLRITV
jgi:hypothetical protein